MGLLCILMKLKKYTSKPFLLAIMGGGCCIFGLLIPILIISIAAYFIVSGKQPNETQTPTLKINEYISLYEPEKIHEIQQIEHNNNNFSQKISYAYTLLTSGDLFFDQRKEIAEFSPKHSEGMKVFSLVWRNLKASKEDVLNFYGNQLLNKSASNMLFTHTQSGIESAQANVGQGKIWILLWDNEKTTDIDVLRVIVQYPVN